MLGPHSRLYVAVRVVSIAAFRSPTPATRRRCSIEKLRCSPRECGGSDPESCLMSCTRVTPASACPNCFNCCSLNCSALCSKAECVIVPNRHLRDALRAKTYEVFYHDFVGAHDYASWRETLADG